MRVQRFLAVRIAIAPEGLERNSDQIRSSILVLKGTRCKKKRRKSGYFVPYLRCRAAARYAPRGSTRCAVRLSEGRSGYLGGRRSAGRRRRRSAGRSAGRWRSPCEALDALVAVSVSVGPT